MTPAQVLRRASEAYRNGDIQWGQGWFRHPETECRCAGGALAFAVRSDDDDPTTSYDGETAMWVLARYLVDELGAPRATTDPDDDVMDVIETVGGWNDTPGRTPDEVIAALEAASERAS